MGTDARPDDMSAIEWLIAVEEIKQLKARRDRYVDAHDWDAYEALHAPDHVSNHAPDRLTGVQAAPWTSSAEMMVNIRKAMDIKDMTTIHHSYDPDIVFDSPEKARGIWAMTGATTAKDKDGEPTWQVSYGYYYESYEKRDGRWLFTSRQWHRLFGVGSDGVIEPLNPAKGSDAFDADVWA